MIFAHAPLGYLTAYATRRWWQGSTLSRRQQRWLYTIAGLGGIFPDIDLLYFYFVNATVNHRQFWTHAALPYLPVLCLGVIVMRSRSVKLRWLGIICSVFSLGVYSHLLADSLVGRLIWLYPLATSLYGLSSWERYAHSVFFSYSLTTNYSAEAIVFILAGYTFIRRKIWYVVIATLMMIPVIAALLWFDNHTYKTDSVFAYNDNDRDGIVNIQDSDIDGDGYNNSVDNDADNDGISNQLELDPQRDMALGSYYDFTQGAFIQIPLRIGLVNDQVLVERLYTNSGMPFAAELTEDFKRNPSGYQFSPKDYRFADDIHNWQTWFQHQRRWFSPESLLQAQPYDIIFFQSGHVALFYPEIDGMNVIDVSAQQPFTSIVSLSEVEAREGKIVGVGQLIQ